jgi:3-deoxy-D-manno-octulosonate 8-phosphate phosphatase (KDO 8-P phosphatase)
MKLKNFVLDVDGVMTDGTFQYDKTGKKFKTFGPDDSDGLKALSKVLKIHFVSADERGFEITKKRVHSDMGYKLDLVPSASRLDWIKENYGLLETIYMGDGFYDFRIFKQVGYSICPNDTLDHCKRFVNFTTLRNGGNRAVAEACIHILDNFFPEIMNNMLDQ